MRLSYSFANEIINAPHTYLCKVMGIPRIERPEWQEGKEVHRIVQDHVSGVKTHPTLEHLPTFDKVEKIDRDPEMKIELKHKGYDVVGYVDVMDTKRLEFGDIKSGQPWSIGKLRKSPQFALYSLALGYTKFWLINLPRNPATWTKENVTLINYNFSKTEQQKSLLFLDRAISIIENIKEEVKNEDFNKTRWNCNYKNCPYCGRY